MPISTHNLIAGKKTVRGWYSGHAKDSEETLAFAALRGIRPMVETYPLAETETAYQRMGGAASAMYW
jgi:D-arabinose 1-dehydrogenase-like Zn-dependent alcohol dehydrogenase